MIPVHDNDFKRKVIESDVPVLVILGRHGWATAEIIMPVIEHLAAEYDGRIRMLKYDMDHCQKIALQYQAEEQTTLLFFKDGQLIARTGILPRAEIEQLVKSLVTD